MWYPSLPSCFLKLCALQRGTVALCGPALKELSKDKTMPHSARAAFCEPIKLARYMDKEINLGDFGKHGTVSLST